MNGPPLLIVAVVGGTNIGKSVIFNHLAGETASAATPLAAGTKHPVCLVPPGCGDPALLARLFEQFELHAWQSADDPLSDAAADNIYWRVGRNVPPRLVLVDAPDVDSDVTVNWQRARAVRQTADVLIALLTQQKYNDAAVKQFFRAAVEADKPIIVIFNLCDLEADRDYWPQWLARFRAETGAKPELIYMVPSDRAAAKELRLPFYRLDTRLTRRFQLPSNVFHPRVSATNWPPCTSTPSRSAPFAGRWRGCSIRTKVCRATSARSAPRPGSSPRRPPPCQRPRWPESPGRACPQACWWEKCSSGGTPDAATGRGGFMAFIASLAAGSCGRCEPRGRP